MPDTTIVAEGIWCTDCEYFEVPDVAGGMCLACGCPVSAHRSATVVAEHTPPQEGQDV